ncbi:hypothetical protein D3C78_1976350 [compost metagenome]
MNSYFSALMAMPRMISLWKIMKNSKIGRMERIDMANIGPYWLTPSELMKLRSARGTV